MRKLCDRIGCRYVDLVASPSNVLISADDPDPDRLARFAVAVDFSLMAPDLQSTSSGYHDSTSEGALVPSGEGRILLFDGLCGFCDRAVRFILRRDPGGTLMFAPLHGPTAQAILDRNPDLREIDSLILWEGTMGEETTWVQSEAVIRVGRYLGGIWGLVLLWRVIPRPMRDWSYALFARHRYRVFGRYEACPVPSPEVRKRFLP